VSHTSYGRLIQRCVDRRLAGAGKQLHGHLIVASGTADNYLASKLIALYSKIHLLSYARNVFDEIPRKNAFAFNALLICYNTHCLHGDVLKLFAVCLSGKDEGMDLVDVEPDSFTLSCVLKSMSAMDVCVPLSGGMIHCYAVKKGLDSGLFVGNGLVTYYSRCDDLVSARALFDEMVERDLVSWNSMLSGYSQGGYYEDCKELYRSLLGMNQIRPDGVTAVCILHACAESMDLLLGMEVHQLVIDNGIEMDLPLCNSLLALYAKCGSLDYAEQIFTEMTAKDGITYSTIVSAYMVHGFMDEAMKIFRELEKPGMSTWNALISALVQKCRFDTALDLFLEMLSSDVKPNCVTLSSIIPAVPYVSHLNGAKEIHAYAIKMGSDQNMYVITAMIDAYAKLGFLRGSQKIFTRAKDRSVIVWTAIISAYASHGDANLALSLFYEMLCSKVRPDAVTFTAVLSACAHSGLVDKAWEVFHVELPNYGIQPLANHYACVVSCLCRAGKLSQAVKFVDKMPTEPSAEVWGALLTGASESGDVELAKFVCDHLFELEPENATNYIVLANVYSKAGRWHEAEGIREQLKNLGCKKVAGSSRIETSQESSCLFSRTPMTVEHVITAALNSLPAENLFHLSHSIAAVFHLHLRRLSAVVSSPIIFALTLRRLNSLTLHQKSGLIARHLLSHLILLKSASAKAVPAPPITMKLRDLDAVLLLLLLCELQHHDRDSLGAPPALWRSILREFLSDSILKLSNFGGCSRTETLIRFVESVGRCWNLVGAMEISFAGAKYSPETAAASAAAVVALPSVVVRDGGAECVICTEEMRTGREVCGLPCGHLFHWGCILTWLEKRSTCPCCRHHLPTEDVRREIQRLMEEIVKIGGG
ncbi:hypothetical protein M569_02628, partial [Genlisea aurea]